MAQEAYDVFFFEAFAEEAAALRRYAPPEWRAGYTGLTIQEAAGGAQPPAPLISIRTQSVIPPAWAVGLAGVLTRSTGYDHIAAYRRAAGTVPAGYLPRYCAQAVAEQALLLWLALLRRLPRQLAQMPCFARDGLTGGECAGRTLAVVGVGNIGSVVCRLGQGLGMQVLAVDPVQRHPQLTYVPIETALARADVVVCAMNLTAGNRGFFSLERWRTVRRGAVFVNVARGELAPPAALLQALDAGWLGGVGLDVYEHEPVLAGALRARGAESVAQATDVAASVAATLELLRRDQVLALPHNAFNTVEAVERKALQSIEAVRQFREGRGFPDSVPDDDGKPEAA